MWLFRALSIPAAPDTYVLTYNVQDAAGNAADPVTRTVTVGDTLRPVIAMTYSGEVLQVSDQSDTGLGGQANAPSGVPDRNVALVLSAMRGDWPRRSRERPVTPSPMALRSPAARSGRHALRQV